MSRGESRPWASIRAIPRNVLNDHGPIFEVKSSQESYYAYYESHRAELELRYKGALYPMLSNLREAYGLVPPRGCCSDEEILNRVLPPALLHLLIMSDDVHGRDCFLGCEGEDTTKFSVTTSPYDYDNKDDLLLYHKQVPLQVLEAIVSVHKPNLISPWDLSLFVTDLVIRYFGMPSLKGRWVPNCLHILDVYRKSLLGGYYLYKEEENENSLGTEGRKTNAPRYKCGRTNLTKPPVIPSATKLGDAKIEIIAGYSDSGVMDISLSGDTLTLPPELAYLAEHKKPIYLNLIWFERLDPSAGMHFCTVLYLVSNLIQDPKDILCLQEGGKFKSIYMGETQIEMIKDLCSKYVRFERSRPANPHLAKLARRLKHRHKENRMKEWRKDFCVRHLKTPWKVISLFAGSLLLSLTIIQTVFGVLGYYYKR